MRRILKTVAIILLGALLSAAVIAIRIYSYGNTAVDMKADAAVVLGAAVWGKRASPVFEERINHALSLYRSGKVRKIIFTGGIGNPNESPESVVARDYAIASGVPKT